MSAQYGPLLEEFLSEISEEFREPVLKALKGNNNPSQKEIDQAIRAMLEGSSARKSGYTLEELTFLGPDEI